MFVAAEFALVAADRTRIEQEAAAGSRGARTALTLLKRLSFNLSGAQLGITMVSLVLGFIAEPTIARLIEPLFSSFLGDATANGVAIVLALLLATFAQMVLGELIPKGLAIAAPERASIVLAPFVRVYGLVFGPIISFLNGAANATVRRLGIEPQEELSHVRSLQELALVIEASAEEGTLAGSASALLARSIRFGEKSVAEVLIPRVEIEALSAEQSVADLVVAAGRSGRSRFPISGADLDDLVGVVHVKVAHQVPRAERATTPLASVMAPILAIPETRTLEDVLFDMRTTRGHLMAVVDEYGGTAGIVTLEDVLEEIVGEIDDEYDPLTPPITDRTSDGGYLVSGALHFDEVREATGFSMPDGEYETLAGFVLDVTGHIPEVGESFEHAGWQVTVEGVERRRVALIRLNPPPETDLASGPPAGSGPDHGGDR